MSPIASHHLHEVPFVPILQVPIVGFIRESAFCITQPRPYPTKNKNSNIMSSYYRLLLLYQCIIPKYLVL
jgi:hypothetical protein